LKGKISSKELMGYFGLDMKKIPDDSIDLEGRVKDNYIEINVALDKNIYKRYLKQ